MLARQRDRWRLGPLRKAQQRRADSALGDWPEVERRLLDALHPKQRDLAEDTHRRIVAVVPRGGGKTTTVIVRFVRRMKRTRRARLLYIATSRTQGESLIWEPLKALNEKHKLGLTFNETKLVARDPRTGAVFRIVGADDKREIEKLRGQPFHEVWIDEAASHPAHILKSLILRIIGPRLGDFGGTLGMVGTPGRVKAGVFYDVTRVGSEENRPYEKRSDPEFAGWLKWSYHRWELTDNDRVHRPDCEPGCTRLHLWEEALVEKQANGWTDQNPIWRSEYLALWSDDGTESIFKYRPHLDDGTPWNQWPGKQWGAAWVPEGFDLARTANPFGLPDGHEWRFVYGMDLGSADPFALEVFAYSLTHRTLFHVYEFTAKRMYARTIAAHLLGPAWVERIAAGRDPGEPGGVVALTGWPDGAVADLANLGGAFIQELAEVYGFAAEAAEKRHKHDAIELFNGDLIDGRVKVLKGSQLEVQMLDLQWVIDDAGRLSEPKGPRNDCCDAAIYVRRHAQHKYAGDPPAPRPAKGTPEADELEARESIRRLQERESARRRGDPFAGVFDDDFTTFFGDVR